MKSAIIIQEPIFNASERYNWNEMEFGRHGVGIAEEYVRGEGDLIFRIRRFKKQYKIDKKTFRDFVNADKFRRVQTIKGKRIGIIPVNLLQEL